jgi:anti-sigma factor RsiW
MKHISKRKLSAFLDGEVSEPQKNFISGHLKSCSYCQKELHKISQVLDYLDSMEKIRVSPYFMVRLKQRIAERESERIIHLPFLEWVRRIAIPVGATALFVLSFLLGSHLGTTIYQEKTSKTLQAGKEFDNLSGITLFDDLPEGSLGDAYAGLLTEGGE